MSNEKTPQTLLEKATKALTLLRSINLKNDIASQHSQVDELLNGIVVELKGDTKEDKKAAPAKEEIKKEVEVKSTTANAAPTPKAPEKGKDGKK